MANYYTEASFLFDLETGDNEKAATAVLEEITQYCECETNEAAKAFKWSSDDMANLAKGLDLEDYEMLSVEISNHNDTVWWMCHDENINVDQAATLIQFLMIKLDLDPMGFEWSNTCSKARLDAFGGGACFITKETVEFINTGSWIDQKQKAYEAAN